jgi:hypothetical protein
VAGPAPRRPRTGDEAAPARRAGSLPTALPAAWGVWALAVLVSLVVWGVVSVANGRTVYFWPGWMAGPWGAVLVPRTLVGGRSRGLRDDGHPISSSFAFRHAVT